MSFNVCKMISLKKTNDHLAATPFKSKRIYLLALFEKRWPVHGHTYSQTHALKKIKRRQRQRCFRQNLFVTHINVYIDSPSKCQQCLLFDILSLVGFLKRFQHIFFSLVVVLSIRFDFFCNVGKHRSTPFMTFITTF